MLEYVLAIESNFTFTNLLPLPGKPRDFMVNYNMQKYVTSVENKTL